MPIEIEAVDYHNSTQAADLIRLLDMYAQDPMGGGAPLAEHIKAELPQRLAQSGLAFSFIAYVDGQPAGLVNCVKGFSTFAAKPLVNIHDIAVAPEYRGLGLSQRLLEQVETVARESGCCKVTLEVLEGNDIALNAYKKSGFSGYELDPKMGNALFWQKKI